VILPKLDGGISYFKDIAPALSRDRWGFINAEGQWVIEPQFVLAGEFHEDLAAVGLRANEALGKESSLKFGFVDRQGKFVIEPSYTQVGTFSDGFVPVRKLGLWGYINSTGNVAVPLQFEEAMDFSEGLAAVKLKGLWGFIDRHGWYVIKPQFEEVKPFHDGQAPVKVGQRWGYMDLKGQWTIEPKFVTAGIFSNGLASVNDSGYIDINGNEIVGTGVFSHAHDFSEGLAAVQVREPNKYKIGKWGYIDTKGRWVIQPRFQIAKDFQGGMARVSKDKNNTQRGYIHQNGKLVWDPADWEKSAALKNFWKIVAMVVGFLLPVYAVYVLQERKKQSYYLQTIG
jgi:hypothetical protein